MKNAMRCNAARLYRRYWAMLILMKSLHSGSSKTFLCLTFDTMRPDKGRLNSTLVSNNQQAYKKVRSHLKKLLCLLSSIYDKQNLEKSDLRYITGDVLSLLLLCLNIIEYSKLLRRRSIKGVLKNDLIINPRKTELVHFTRLSKTEEFNGPGTAVIPRGK